MKKILIATKNQDKITEILDLLSDINMKLISFQDIDFNENIEETGRSFQENAVIKALTAGRKTKITTLAEDSGLEIDALGGRPGIYSARYKDGSDMDRCMKILCEMKNISKEKRTARFITIVAIYEPLTEKVVTFEGMSEGYITDKPLGKNGFGYDSIFYNFALKKTNGQAKLAEKNKVSHRSEAILKAKQFLIGL
ncbi:non-canonical purine NTP pyrophosphatase, RdgB/HAM1 family [Candidatus Gottesmanbacteria bacterium CG11_big_fil_rev_8_21_14_0_20_37_11]|uniref:dITP/XTP pyrophosphatase n=3 Tax=Candidatus Gottesmaniibacteriota TaxID=1752720 RepID=A0A2M7RR30_9BACT|nr:MAG: non-canonical purine NTP pyrophosphatase, RdgB/HAM1 family [Candidatus Gottesmanbacteria bacterium CG1_02_37_22]PIP33113.1 MAG: non-canonical purine NTP pyrophosphatase, RdgB/HAM1 family [Candidatus Gottesmanbacteria bacterium CG23_combo_of_CG06-09_8_20_14_all_37_19]PIR08121.1 MAG: non-canonical purine NTP pyrophosphatase, RdgB/HAM1 family [Candidatus Gottesmanbacteria bacterium CG11_big_fil_rev_8_21_14_0_20_37_11]PIZ02771.1 MAG: non-canonical purine NTP pyrophosphatase, RdgB/HAM1 family